jgi:integrase
LPAFLASLREQEDIAALAMEFLILTAARTGEAIGARWAEIDLLDKTWTVPAARMKRPREHRVPLSARALAIPSGRSRRSRVGQSRGGRRGPAARCRRGRPVRQRYLARTG